MYRVRDGRMCEHWNVVDMFGFAQQVGLLSLAPDGARSA
jgi:predicted SnoaL-like aldol condensation-catalyzing enzyme